MDIYPEHIEEAVEKWVNSMDVNALRAFAAEQMTDSLLDGDEDPEDFFERIGYEPTEVEGYD
jgi:hypothetical protein